MTPLVLVHGFLGGSAQWERQSPMGRDREVIALDLPGFGANAHRSPLTRIEEMADWWLEQIADRGVDRFHLLGHSMGGMIAQEMAHRAGHRVDSLVLYATGSVGALPGRFEPISVSKERAQADGAQQTARRIAATWFRDRETAPSYPDCARIAEAAGLSAVLTGLDAMGAWSGAARLGELAVPTLLIWGDADRTYPWEQTEQLWRGIANSRLAVVPGAAHAVHLEKPDLFNMILGDFLNTSIG